MQYNIAMHIRVAFLKLLARISPTTADRESLERHIAAIRVRLRMGFKLRNFFLVGSASRGTFIRVASDADVFAVIARDDARWGKHYVGSDTVLDNFRDHLKGRFRNTPIGRDVQAVVVPFSDVSIDVVPAFFYKAGANGWPIFAMPDGSGNWMYSSPLRHNTYIRKADNACGGKIRRTAQLLKFWRECRSPRIPISSFHIEMLLAAANVCSGVKSYPQCVYEVLQLLAQRECRGFADPIEISGIIRATQSEPQRTLALASIRDSRFHAELGLRAERLGEMKEAIRQWDIVFNGNL
jgi:hypothetical protein